MNISDFINSENIFFLTGKNKHAILTELVEKAKDLNAVDMLAFKKAIKEREALLSTGIGLGVAIPHAKSPHLKKFFVLTGIIETPVDWESIDQKPVSLVFLIGAPENAQQQYLKLLSKIMVVVKNPEKREKLLEAKNISDVSVIFK